jgi:hypothetical protein
MRYMTLVCLFFSATAYVDSLSASAEEADASGIALFDAIDQGDVKVQFIAMNARQANVLIKNESDKPLTLKMPKAIAAVPVLGQFGQNQNLNQNAGGGGTNQGVGGGFDMRNGRGAGNQQGFQNGQGFGMGIMRIAPGKVCKLKATTVCLEHGKPDPKPRVAYRMIPLETFTDDPIILELCQKLGAGHIPQKIAQAIAWHQANELTWTQLADLHQMQSLYRGNIKFFSTKDLNSAKTQHASMLASNSLRPLLSFVTASASQGSRVIPETRFVRKINQPADD